MNNYKEFLELKKQKYENYGFKPIILHDFLFDFQKYLVDFSLKKGRSAIFADTGLGKGQPENSKILTTQGYKLYKDLTLNDKVFDSQGMQRNIIGIYPKNELKTYRIYFSDKNSHVFDEDHLHIVRTYNDRVRNKNWRVLSTKELLQKKLYCGNIVKRKVFDIPIVKPIEFDKKELPIHPYILGVLLANGYLKNEVRISSNDIEVIEKVRSLLPKDVQLKYKDKYDYSIKTGITGCKRHYFRQILCDLGLFGLTSSEKFIPSQYLYSDVNDRIELLRGLMDCDGYIKESSQYYSTSKQLIEDVKFLIQSLGGIPILSEKIGKYKKDGILHICKKCYTLTFSLNTFNPFFLSRKSKLWNNNPRDNGRWITKIEYEDMQKTICISVDSPDNSYIIDDCIVTHNTAMFLSWADNVVRQTNGNVLILTPLAVSYQTLKEAEKFGIELHRSRDGQSKGKLTVTNYQQLEKFNPNDFVGVVCDESSAIKAFEGQTKKNVTRFMNKMSYRLLCTATPSPNDYVELGTSSEALGYLKYMDMLSYFFRDTSNDKNPQWSTPKWVLKGHAVHDFWRWVCSWAIALKKPSDLGFADEKFILPRLNEKEHILKCTVPLDGMLFVEPARTLKEQREERKKTVDYRIEKVNELCQNYDYSVIWGQYNYETDLMEKLIKDSVQISGSDSDESKEEKFNLFSDKQIKRLIIKPKIGAWGLNWQHCNHMTFFPSHSFEMYYQGVRRCWRFGQNREVHIDIVTTEGEEAVIRNIQRKARDAEKMFELLVKYMTNELNIVKNETFQKKLLKPNWLKSEEICQ